MQRYCLNLDDADFAAFRAHIATRLYLYERKHNGDVIITASNMRRLAADLERAIDFGATTALEVLHNLDDRRNPWCHCGPTRTRA